MSAIIYIISTALEYLPRPNVAPRHSLCYSVYSKNPEKDALNQVWYTLRADPPNRSILGCFSLHLH